MKNSINNIGERIKNERLKAGMTQTELASGRISRNMLSMIENGEALPSLETLEHISNALDVPAGLFFSDSETTDALYEKIDAITKAKAMFKSSMYEECSDTCKKVPLDDELSMILAESQLKLAEEDMKRCMLSSAASHIRTARESAKKTCYLGEDFFGTLDSYEDLISFANEKIDIDTVIKDSKKPSRIPASYFTFLIALSYVESDDEASATIIQNIVQSLEPHHIKYLRSKELARSFKFSQALDILLPLYESEKIGFIEKYRILAEIESCYENKRDFEAAYKYSTMKHHMLECFAK